MRTTLWYSYSSRRARPPLPGFYTGGPCTTVPHDSSEHKCLWSAEVHETGCPSLAEFARNGNLGQSTSRFLSRARAPTAVPASNKPPHHLYRAASPRSVHRPLPTRRFHGPASTETPDA